MTTLDNGQSSFATSMTRGPVARWQRKALQANNQDSSAAPKTPGKSGDRFIPSRSSMNMDACHFNLMSRGGENEAPDSAFSPSKAELQRSLKNNLFQDQSSKILAFKSQAPKPQQGMQSDAKVLYTQNKASSKVSSSRHIPQAPERMLDAPEFRLDYYLNLIDWGASNLLAVALGDTVYAWNAGTGDIQEVCCVGVEGSDNYVSSVSWAHDGNYLAVGVADSTVQLWDVAASKKVRTMTGHEARVASMDWNQHILTSGSKTGTIFNSDVRVQNHIASTLQGHTQEVCGLKWSPDGQLLASGGNDNIVNVWGANNSIKQTLTDHQAAVKALAWCPWQSNLLATGGGSADRHIRFWNVNSGSCVNSIDTKSQVCSLLWNKEHREIISGHGYSRNQLTIWKYPTLSKVAELTGHTDRVLSMAMSPDGSTVVSAGADENLRFWKCFASEATKKKTKKTESSRSRLTGMIR